VEERGLIVERLDDQTLVYDTELNEAHALSGAGAAEFLAAANEVSRRQVLRKLALAGAAATGAGVVVKTIVAPTAAQAQSLTCTPGCTVGLACCQPIGNFCCATGVASFGCCPGGGATACGGFTGFPCSFSNICCSGTCNIPQGQAFGVCA
jgi:hypothetical protein